MYGKSTKPTAAVGKAQIRKNDEVLVISGKDRGKRARSCASSLPRVPAIVERVNFRKKHQRPNPQKNVKGGILEREAPIRPVEPDGHLPCLQRTCQARTRTRTVGTVRFCRKCNTELAG
jgi:ribosomal protein L24